MEEQIQQQQQPQMELPKNRFELELEFVQALASPAYLHFLATSPVEDGAGTASTRASSTASVVATTILQDPAFIQFLRYLRETWTRPEYSRFLQYPNALYFLDLLIEKPSVIKEFSQQGYRNFCHQQQYLAWQHRHSVLYGKGSLLSQPEDSASHPEQQMEHEEQPIGNHSSHN